MLVRSCVDSLAAVWIGCGSVGVALHIMENAKAGRRDLTALEVAATGALLVAGAYCLAQAVAISCGARKRSAASASASASYSDSDGSRLDVHFRAFHGDDLMEDNCCVCREPFERGSRAFHCIACRKYVHAACMMRAMRMGHLETCPMCRARLK